MATNQLCVWSTFIDTTCMVNTCSLLTIGGGIQKKMCTCMHMHVLLVQIQYCYEHYIHLATCICEVRVNFCAHSVLRQVFKVECH